MTSLMLDGDVMRIALIVGSTRPNRFADHPVKWIQEGAATRSDFDLEILDLPTGHCHFSPSRRRLSSAEASSRIRSLSFGDRRSPSSTASSYAQPSTITGRRLF